MPNNEFFSLMLHAKTVQDVHPTRHLALEHSRAAYQVVLNPFGQAHGHIPPGWNYLDRHIVYSLPAESSAAASKNRNTQCKALAYLSPCKKTLVLCFQGTKSNNDILTDLNELAFNASTEYCRAVERFVYSVLDHELVRAAIEAKDFKILFTGHSLGGFAARHAALTIALLDKFPEKIKLYLTLIDGAGYGDTRQFFEDRDVSWDEAQAIFQRRFVTAENLILEPNVVNMINRHGPEKIIQLHSQKRGEPSRLMRTGLGLMSYILDEKLLASVSNAVRAHSVKFFSDLIGNPDMLGDHVSELPRLVHTNSYTTFQIINSVTPVVITAENKAIALAVFGEFSSYLIEQSPWPLLEYYKSLAGLALSEDQQSIIINSNIPLESCRHFLQFFFALTDEFKNSTVAQMKHHSLELLIAKVVFTFKTFGQNEIELTPAFYSDFKDFIFLTEAEIKNALEQCELFNNNDGILTLNYQSKNDAYLKMAEWNSVLANAELGTYYANDYLMFHADQAEDLTQSVQDIREFIHELPLPFHRLLLVSQALDIAFSDLIAIHRLSQSLRDQSIGEQDKLSHPHLLGYSLRVLRFINRPENNFSVEERQVFFAHYLYQPRCDINDIKFILAEQPDKFGDLLEYLNLLKLDHAAWLEHNLAWLQQILSTNVQLETAHYLAIANLVPEENPLKSALISFVEAINPDRAVENLLSIQQYKDLFYLAKVFPQHGIFQDVFLKEKRLYETTLLLGLKSNFKNDINNFIALAKQFDIEIKVNNQGKCRVQSSHPCCTIGNKLMIRGVYLIYFQLKHLLKETDFKLFAERFKLDCVGYANIKNHFFNVFLFELKNTHDVGLMAELLTQFEELNEIKKQKLLQTGDAFKPNGVNIRHHTLAMVSLIKFQLIAMLLPSAKREEIQTLLIAELKQVESELAGVLAQPRPLVAANLPGRRRPVYLIEGTSTSNCMSSAGSTLST